MPKISVYNLHTVKYKTQKPHRQATIKSIVHEVVDTERRTGVLRYACENVVNGDYSYTFSSCGGITEKQCNTINDFMKKIKDDFNNKSYKVKWFNGDCIIDVNY